MKIEFKGKLNYMQLRKISNYLYEHFVEICILKKPIYIYEAKISKHKNKILIEV